MWRRFFSGVVSIGGYFGPAWRFKVYSLGPLKGPQEVVIAQRRTSTFSIRSQKLLSKSGNRIYAWRPDLTGFSKPSDPRKRERIQNLRVYIAKLSNNEYWAGWLHVEAPKTNWETNAGLMKIFAANEGYIEFQRDTYFDAADPDWPFRNQAKQTISAEEIELTDTTEKVDKDRIIRRAKVLLSAGENKVVTKRIGADLSGLNRSTSTYTGPIRTKHHVAVELSTKLGRGLNVVPVALPSCAGGIVYAEPKYEGLRTTGQLVRFNDRMKRIMQALKGSADGPNPDNIRMMLTNATTDAKVLPIDDLIGFNAINDSEPDAFWLIAAAREVAYLKYGDRYRHLRLMTELIVRGFANLHIA
jgi:hypothetical protein